MNKIILIVLATAIVTNTLYTSSFFEKQGINVKDGIF